MLSVLAALVMLQSSPADSLRAQIERRIQDVPGAIVGVSLRDLGSGDSLDINADESFHAASTMKVPVMIELFRQAERGWVSLDQPVMLVNQFGSIVDASPFSVDAGDDSDSLLYNRVGQRVPVRELMNRMITRSSNLATNALIALIGPERANATAHELGANNIQVLRGVEDQKAFDAGRNNSTTARDLATLLAAIETGRAASRASCDAMKKILLDQEFNDEIPAGLPPGTPVAHKTGWITGVLHDAAIVYPRSRAPYVLVVLTKNIPNDTVARALIADVSRLVYRSLAGVASASRKTENVLLVVSDGLRWQDVFRGADSTILFDTSRATPAARAKYWRSSPSERRQAVMPFFWSTVAAQGQLFGNRDLGSDGHVTNGLKFSYPGYNEMLAGFPDSRIDKNEYGPNPNITVFEWLNQQHGLRGRVAALATWDAFHAIFNEKRANMFVQAGWPTPFSPARDSAERAIDTAFAHAPREWEDNTPDEIEHPVVMHYLRELHPRVLFIGYGETDERAHAGRYDLTLDAAHDMDGYLAELWSAIQSDPLYRGRTTMIVTTDHGRGRTTRDWSDHGKEVDGAEEWWVAVIGPDTPALGERRNVPAVTQSQIAATVAALLGYNYVSAVPTAAPPLPVP
jgi:beta-lactamase class A